jgi:hypothetical protein
LLRVVFVFTGLVSFIAFICSQPGLLPLGVRLLYAQVFWYLFAGTVFRFVVYLYWATCGEDLLLYY